MNFTNSIGKADPSSTSYGEKDVKPVREIVHGLDPDAATVAATSQAAQSQ